MHRSLLFFVLLGTLANAGSVVSYFRKGSIHMAGFEGAFLAVGVALSWIALRARDVKKVAQLTAILFIAHNMLFFVVTGGANAGEVLLHFTIFPTLFIYYLGVRPGLVWSAAALFSVSAPLVVFSRYPSLPRLFELESKRELVLPSIAFLYLVQMGFNALFQRSRMQRIDDLEALNQELARQLELQKRLEAEALRNSKLVAIGQLAAGVTHEINNPLMSAMAQSELLTQKLGESDDAISTHLRLQWIALERIKAIVAGLRTFSHHKAPALKAFDAHAAILECFALLEGIFRGLGVRLERDFSAREHWIMGDVGRFNQVVVNLMCNARDAVLEPLEQKDASRSADSEPWVRVSTRDEDGKFRVEVADNGCGISPENLNKIFDAFFTTKAAGKGTGLGLSLSSAIVSEMNGQIQARSTPGCGSVFSVEVPVCAMLEPAMPESFAHPRASRPPERPFHGIPSSFKALILDDEEALASYLRSQFELWGIQCEAVTDFRDAIQKARTQRYDVIVSDMHMLGIQPQELIRVLATESKDHPKLILMTGSLDHEFQIDQFAILRIFEKPFDIREMLELLDKHFGGATALAGPG